MALIKGESANPKVTFVRHRLAGGVGSVTPRFNSCIYA